MRAMDVSPIDEALPRLLLARLQEARGRALADPDLAGHWQAGAQMSFDEVAAYVLALDPARDASPAGA